MSRPRWHDAVLVAAIVGLLVAGIWSLWGDEVRSVLHLGPGSADAVAPIAQDQT
jgi:hypothetical protein